LQYEEKLALAWTKLVRVSSIHFFGCWDTMIIANFHNTVAALQWVDREIAQAPGTGGGFFPQELSQLTLLDIVVSVPCIMLVRSGSRLIQDAALAMPTFRQWVQSAVTAFQTRQPWMKTCLDSSPLFRMYVEQLVDKEGTAVFVSFLC
jgi:hypothetical protein